MGRLFASRGATVAVMGVVLALVAGGSYALAASGSKSITVCVKKKGGALYKAKKCKKHDSKLTWNQKGPAGKAGKNGTNGLNGAPGAAGAAGVSGKDGFVQMGSWEGAVQDTIAASSTDFVFAGPTTTVTTTSSQAVAASGSAALGLTAAGPARVEVGICSQPAAGGDVVPLATDTGTFEIVDVTTTRIPFAFAEAGTPGAGAFNIGMCVENNSTTAIDSNDWSIGYAFVTDTSLSVTAPDMALAKSKANAKVSATHH